MIRLYVDALVILRAKWSELFSISTAGSLWFQETEWEPDKDGGAG